MKNDCQGRADRAARIGDAGRWLLGLDQLT
jgi:hypothetical protein